MEEEAVLKKLYRKYQKRLLNFILQKVKKQEDAEEILQDTFLSALDSLPLFRQEASFYTWLCAIAKHEIADFYRKRRLKTIVFSRFPKLGKVVSQALSPDAALEARELEEEMIRCFKSLSEGYARILRLKYVDGLSYKAIGKKLKQPVKTIESRLFRARKAFAKNWRRRSHPAKSYSFGDS
jgi:RNA polymerase sigma-70 factor (ECF subfamily)